jgi:hypothetical protein
MLSQLPSGDADRIQRAIGIADFDGPLAVGFERVFDVACQPFGRKPCFPLAKKLLTDVILMRFAVRDAKKVPGHYLKTKPRRANVRVEAIDIDRFCSESGWRGEPRVLRLSGPAS